MGFPSPDRLREYIKTIVDIESFIEPQYRRYWYNDSWMPGVVAAGYINDDGSSWTVAFTEHHALLKSFSPEETNNYGIIFPEDLPEWARSIYNNPLWDADSTTSLVVGYSDGVWEEPWLAKVWWPIQPLHMGLPFSESDFKLWFESLGYADQSDMRWMQLQSFWTDVYNEPLLEWEAIGEGTFLEKSCDF